MCLLMCVEIQFVVVVVGLFFFSVCCLFSVVGEGLCCELCWGMVMCLFCFFVC